MVPSAIDTNTKKELLQLEDCFNRISLYFSQSSYRISPVCKPCCADWSSWFLK